MGDKITIGFELDIEAIVTGHSSTNNDFLFNAGCYRSASDSLTIDYSTGKNAVDSGFFDECSSPVPKSYSLNLDWQYYFVSDDNNIAAISGFSTGSPSFSNFENEYNDGTKTFKINSGIEDQFNSVGHWDAYIVIENTVFQLENGFDVIPEPSSIYLLGMGFLLLRYRVRK